MKSKIISIAAMAIGVLLAGCVTSAKLNDIRVGMSKDEVIALLGTPDSTSAQANIVYLTYYLTVNTSRSYDQPYLVRLVDGKVESFGRFAQLSDIYYRPPAGTGQPGGATNLPPAMAYPGVPGAYPPNETDIATQLQILKKLRDQGALTEEEFQKGKARLLSGQ